MIKTKTNHYPIRQNLFYKKENFFLKFNLSIKTHMK